jgi:hypothetical protein
MSSTTRIGVPYVWACIDLQDVAEGRDRLIDSATKWVAEGIPWNEVEPILRRLNRKHGGNQETATAILSIFQDVYEKLA